MVQPTHALVHFLANRGLESVTKTKRRSVHPFRRFFLCGLYSLCPLLCAALGKHCAEQILFSLQLWETASTASCCQGTSSSPTESENQMPVEGRESCSQSSPPMIVPDTTAEESAVPSESLVISLFLPEPVKFVILSELSVFRLSTSTFHNAAISYRGPPHAHIS